jgi:hypothetical protein
VIDRLTGPDSVDVVVGNTGGLGATVGVGARVDWAEPSSESGERRRRRPSRSRDAFARGEGARDRNVRSSEPTATTVEPAPPSLPFPTEARGRRLASVSPSPRSSPAVHSLSNGSLAGPSSVHSRRCCSILGSRASEVDLTVGELPTTWEQKEHVNIPRGGVRPKPESDGLRAIQLKTGSKVGGACSYGRGSGRLGAGGIEGVLLRGGRAESGVGESDGSAEVSTRLCGRCDDRTDFVEGG